MSKPKTVDDYIARLAPELRETAEAVRAAIRKAIPDATEAISYSMPAYKVGKKTALYFAVWKKHVGLYPIFPADEALEAKLNPYRDTRATVQLPLKAPIPFELVAEIARHQGRRSRPLS